MSDGLRRVRRARRALVRFSVSATLLVPPVVDSAAQGTAEPTMVPLTAPGVSPRVALHIGAQDDALSFLLAVETPAGCKYPIAFTMPVTLDEDESEKRVARFSQQALPDGSCIEVLGTVFTRTDFAALTRARRIALTLPSGTILLPQPAIDYVRSLQGPARIATDHTDAPASASEDFEKLSGEVLRLASMGRYADAVPIADRAVRASEGRPIDDRILALSNGAYVKRHAGDDVAAAAGYEQAIAVADGAGYEAPALGIALDNLARLRTDQKDYAAAEALSRRALTILGRTVGEMDSSYGEALNNLALMYHSKGDMALAVEYSDRAIAVLRQALRGDAAALAPFLADNRAIKSAARAK